MSSSRKVKPRVLLLDADSGVYACGFQSQKKTHFVIHIPSNKVLAQDGDKRKINKYLKEQTQYPAEELELDEHVDLRPWDECRRGVRTWLRHIMEFSTCRREILYLTKGGEDFRTRLATIQRYKGNRMGTPKPHYYDKIREYLSKQYGAHTFRYWEADDAVCMTMNKKNDNQYILAAVDKDLDQMPGKRFNPNHNGPKWLKAEQARRDKAGDTTEVMNEGIYVQSELEGWRCFYVQMLMGDGVDNIKGLSGVKGAPGIGEKKAHTMLADAETVEEMCEIVHAAYVKKYPEPFELTPWWWDSKWDEDEEALSYRKNHPVYGKKKSITADADYMFFENANLLYMLRHECDQYVAPIEYPGQPCYPEGIVAYFTEFKPKGNK